MRAAAQTARIFRSPAHAHIVVAAFSVLRSRPERVFATMVQILEINTEIQRIAPH
jgi:hypothetical protein